MSYPILKLLHVVLVVLFLGNITTAVFWVRHARRARNPARIAEAMDGVIRSDRLFTIPCAVGVVLAGIAAAHVGGLPLVRTGWIAWGFGLFAASGLMFSWLGPLQRRIRAYAARADAEWPVCERLLRRWEGIGAVSLVCAWAALVPMVLKIPA
jgi:uncharacterized membrane protein